MAEFKIVIGDPKTKKSFQKVVGEADAKFFMGKKIGDKFKGESIDLTGYEFEITGGSDDSGFPMRKDVSGVMRKKILTAGGVGFISKRKGMRKRKTVAGNTIYDKTSQINVKVLKHGKKALGEEPAAEEKTEEVKEEAPKAEEVPKEEVKKDKEAGLTSLHYLFSK